MGRKTEEEEECVSKLTPTKIRNIESLGRRFVVVGFETAGVVKFELLFTSFM